MEIKNKLLFFICLGCSQLIHAQFKPDENKDRPRNDINLTLGGNGSDLSLNYEKVFVVKQKAMFIGSFGLGVKRLYHSAYEWESLTLTSKKTTRQLTFPFSALWSVGKKRHFLDLGFGVVFAVNEPKNEGNFYPIIGYRFHPKQTGKFNFRVFAVYPIKSMIIIEQYFVPVGLSIGYCF